MTSIDVNQLNAPGVHSATHEAAVLRLQTMLLKGVDRAARIIKLVQEIVPKDYVVKSSKIQFDVSPDGDVLLRIPAPKTTNEYLEFKIHNNALSQIAAEIEMPWSWMLKLMAQPEWGRAYLVEGLELFYGRLSSLFLLRAVDMSVRAFLSNKYKRLDSAPLIDSFCEACAAVGAKPYEGYASDTKIGIQAVIPRLYEPVPGELIAYGVSFANSDFGNGAMSVSIFILRVNSGMGMIGNNSMRKVHLGKRLEEDIDWSDDTKLQDIKLVCSVIKDLVQGQLAEDRLNKAQDAIRTLYNTQVGDKQSVTDLLKKLLSKGDIDKVIEKYNAPDVEELPPGNNLWRLVNAISWLAKNEKDEERQLELQAVAGKLLAL